MNTDKIIAKMKADPACQRAMLSRLLREDGADGVILALTESEFLGARLALKARADKIWQDMADGKDDPWAEKPFDPMKAQA